MVASLHCTGDDRLVEQPLQRVGGSCRPQAAAGNQQTVAAGLGAEQLRSQYLQCLGIHRPEIRNLTDLQVLVSQNPEALGSQILHKGR